MFRVVAHVIMPRSVFGTPYPFGIRGRVARGAAAPAGPPAPALALFLVVFGFVVRLEFIRVEPQLLRFENGDEEVLALGIVALHELLVDLIDQLLKSCSPRSVPTRPTRPGLS